MKKINTSKMKHKTVELTATRDLSNEDICSQYINEQVKYNATTIKELWHEIDAKSDELIRYESKPVFIVIPEPYKSIVDAIAIKEYSHVSPHLFIRKLHRLYSAFNFVMSKYTVKNNVTSNYDYLLTTNDTDNYKQHEVYMGGARKDYSDSVDVLIKHNLINKLTNHTFEAGKLKKHICNVYVINNYMMPTSKVFLRVTDVMAIQAIMTLKRYAMTTYANGKITTLLTQTFANMKIPTWACAKDILMNAITTGELSAKGKQYVYTVTDSATQTSVYDAFGSYVFADNFEILADKEEQLKRIENWGSLIPKIIRKHVKIKQGRTYENIVECDYQSLFINLFLNKFDTNGNTNNFGGDSATKFLEHCKDTNNISYTRKEAKNILNTFMNRGHETKPWLMAKGSCGHYATMTDTNGVNVWNLIKGWLPITVISAFETYKLNDNTKNELYFELCKTEVELMQEVAHNMNSNNYRGIYCYDAMWVPASIAQFVKCIMNIASEYKGINSKAI